MMEAQGQMNVSVTHYVQECFYSFFFRIYALYQALAFQIICRQPFLFVFFILLALARFFFFFFFNANRTLIIFNTNYHELDTNF